MLTAGSDGTLAANGLVGMFIGRGLIMDVHTGDVVRVVTYASLTSDRVSVLPDIA